MKIKCMRCEKAATCVVLEEGTGKMETRCDDHSPPDPNAPGRELYKQAMEG